MKGFAMLGPNKTGFIEKEDPKVGSRVKSKMLV